jgi:hypothetical protein
MRVAWDLGRVGSVSLSIKPEVREHVGWKCALGTLKEDYN